MLSCIFASCSDGENEIISLQTQIDIATDSGIISNELFFDATEGEQSIYFSVNTNWTLSVVSTTDDATWCKASVTSGGKGTATVTFTVDENTGYDVRSALITINAKSINQTFTIIQKGADALLVSTNKYEIAQEGGKIEIEVKANINYLLSVSETAKDWITESKSRTLTTFKHTFEVAPNEKIEKREGEITFKIANKVETVKVCQEGISIVEVTLKDAGSLKASLGKDYLNIKFLKIIGPINGDDVYYLRKMLGGDEFNEDNWGKLNILDLSEASIVEGGGWYHHNNLYTSDNIIGAYMFSQCNLLQNIILPNNVTKIDEYALDGNEITSITIPNSVTSIGSQAFAGCRHLISIIIPDSVIDIGYGAFWECRGLESITIGKNLSSIGTFAFFCCDKISSVYIKDLSSWCKIHFNAEASITNPLLYGGKLYLNNKELTELVIPRHNGNKRTCILRL